MKLLLANLLFACATLATTSGQAQGIGYYAGPVLGLTRTVLDGEINAKSFYKNGFSAGVMMRFRSSKRFAIQPELLYLQRGAGSNGTLGGSSPDYELRLHYVSVPVLAKIYLGSMVNLQAGPQFGVLLSAWDVGRLNTKGTVLPDASIEVSDNYATLDFGLCVGLGLDLPKGLLASARLNYGLADISSQSNTSIGLGTTTSGLHNRGFEFSVGYLFGIDRYKVKPL